MSGPKVQKACQRCRQQKLKCDAQRPCVLCTRAGVACLHQLPRDAFKPYEPRINKRASPSIRFENKRRKGDGPGKAPIAASATPASDVHESVSSSVDALVQEALPVRPGQFPANLGASAIPGTRDDTAGVSQSCEKSISGNLIGYLPAAEAVNLLVDTYFDRVHWFLLAFHQNPFRSRVRDLLRDQAELSSRASQSPSFLASLLCVILIGLRYTGVFRRETLAQLGVDTAILGRDLQEVLKTKFLDIVAIRSLEVVQTCVLLGTYFLFHGEPATAWPIISAGVGVARAIKLDRPLSAGSEVDVQARSRCWWALYEVETFCAMSYGYSSAMRNDQLAVPLPSIILSDQVGRLLEYKASMAKLSVIINKALDQLYGPVQEDLACRVLNLDRELEQWHQDLPAHLQAQGNDPVHHSADELEQDVAAAGPRFEAHLLQLQSLGLRLAYCNTKILIHRPLLSVPSNTAVGRAVRACKTAALATSELKASPVLPLAAHSYAVAFIGMHLFTAGVVFGVIAERDPLGSDASRVKAGLRDLIQTQRLLLAAKSNAVTAQSLEILENLARSLVDRELVAMLGGSGNDSARGVKAQADSTRASMPQPEQMLSPALGGTSLEVHESEYSWLLGDVFADQEQAWMWDLDFTMLEGT
ncbi:hypothetical protein CKM354_000439200 [Cercospora kikuchii]|uniref:Zn(2)-C6 fungal-type domain-containing protein n=1 Tax=Cercospora kikuchii TaxID=84275 RepID=A0A9P3CFT5_9PEZI|nr:uncharacterized protein CKM354_000439200 [Cercospora kikuchii]GIZ41076.1 hypothetical protein CKM354_000439200 [Cercospora kikuchii]